MMAGRFVEYQASCVIDDALEGQWRHDGNFISFTTGAGQLLKRITASGRDIYSAAVAIVDNDDDYGIEQRSAIAQLGRSTIIGRCRFALIIALK